MHTLTLKLEIVCSVMWKNLSCAILPAEIRSIWYVMVRGILRTNMSDKDKRC